MSRETVLDHMLQDLLRDRVIKDTDQNLWGHAAELDQLTVRALPWWGLTGPGGSNWNYSCPGASEAVLAALESHAEDLGRQFNVR